MAATRVSISGLCSEVGKTTLLCDLLHYFPGWEAIKVTRGHYRSCGKDPETCCVSKLLGKDPLVLSGRRDTYQPGKDTGRYWDAGAGNVHWVIGTGDQIAEAVFTALARVTSAGVFIEGNSVLRCHKVDYSIMVANPCSEEIKSSAIKIISKISALYLNRADPDTVFQPTLQASFAKNGLTQIIEKLKVYRKVDLSALAFDVGRAHESKASEQVVQESAPR